MYRLTFRGILLSFLISLLDAVHTGRQKPVILAQKCIECRNFI